MHGIELDRAGPPGRDLRRRGRPHRHGPELHRLRRPRGPPRRPTGRAAHRRSTRRSPGPFDRGVVACTGSEFCRFAVVETKERAVKWARELDAQLVGAEGRRTATGPTGHGCRASSGCTSPAAPRRAPSRRSRDIGFRGDIAHVDEHIEEAVDIGLGGSLGPDAAFIDWVAGAMPVDRVPDALLRVVSRYREDHRPGSPSTTGPAGRPATSCRSLLTVRARR